MTRAAQRLHSVYMNDQQTFIGWQVTGIDAVSSREEDGKIVCLESGVAIWFKALMGLLFGPVITTALVLSGMKDRRTPILAILFMGFFSLIAWYALYRALFRRRSIVFDPSTASIDFREGWTSLKKLSRSDIAALDMRAVERITSGSHGGTARWTSYLVTARLKSGEELPLFESSKEATSGGLYSRIKAAFF